MEFPERIRKKALEASAFNCCLCHRNLARQVHHIDRTLKLEGGLHDYDNAAPMCPTCHDSYGDNPKWKKHIKLARDWWYNHVEKEFTPASTGLLRDMHSKVTNTDSGVEYIKSKVDFLVQSVEQNNPGGMKDLLDAIGTASFATSGSLLTNMQKCPNCGKLLVSYPPDLKCPACGSDLDKDRNLGPVSF